MTAASDHFTPTWSQRLLRLLPLAALVASILISAAYILADSGIVPPDPMDQSFAEIANLRLGRVDGHWVFQYPALQNSGGITSSLIAGIYKLIVPTNHQNLNWHIRILAMSTYLASSFVLARAFIANRWVQLLAFLIIASSGFQFLQPSSDLFAGTSLNLFLVGAQRQWPRLWTALSLAIFGLTKVDMILAAFALALLWFWWDKHNGRDGAFRNIALVVLLLGLLLAPAFLVTGASPFSGSRSTIAFLSAYAEFFGYHQFAGSPIASLQEAMTKAQMKSFDGAQSFPEMVLRHPTLYADFVGVSAARSIPNLINSFKLMLIPIAIIYSQWKRIQANRFLLWGGLIAALCVILPAWLIIFVRIRYVVKCVAPLVVLALAGSLELSRYNKSYTKIAWACGLGTIAWQLFFFSEMAAHSHYK